MIYEIFRKGINYTIARQQKPIASATRVSHFFGDHVLFYDSEKNLIAKSIQKYFLFFDFGHKIYFPALNKTSILKGIGNGIISMDIEGITYQFKYPFFGGPRLCINGIEKGEYKIIRTRVWQFHHEVSCDDEKSCFYFSLMDIILDSFDI